MQNNRHVVLLNELHNEDQNKQGCFEVETCMKTQLLLEL